MESISKLRAEAARFTAMEHALTASIETAAIFMLLERGKHAEATVRAQLAFELGVFTDVESDIALEYIAQHEARRAS